jgi:hypothetical protein
LARAEMTRLVSALIISAVGLAVLAVAGPALAKLFSAAVWLVLAVGFVVCAIRVVWAATRWW